MINDQLKIINYNEKQENSTFFVFLINFEPGCIAAIKPPLRRTLVLF